MILTREQIADLQTHGETTRSIPDTDDLYGWVCGYIPWNNEIGMRHQYSTLHDTSNDHRVIAARGQTYKINEGYEMPVLLRVTCVLIHRGDNNNWLIYLERESAS